MKRNDWISLGAHFGLALIFLLSLMVMLDHWRTEGPRFRETLVKLTTRTTDKITKDLKEVIYETHDETR